MTKQHSRLVDYHPELVYEGAYSPLVEAAAAAMAKAIETAPVGGEGGRWEQFNTVGQVGCELKAYVARLALYMKCDVEIFLSAFILLDSAAAVIPLTQANVHKLFFSCLVVVTKYNVDKPFSNTYYAQIGGIHARDLFKLEAQLLEAVDWQVHIDQALYEQYEVAISKISV